MHRKMMSQQSTRPSSKVWTTFLKVALDGWGSTARLVVLLLVKQSALDVLILLLMHR